MKPLNEVHLMLVERALGLLKDAFGGEDKELLEEEIGCMHNELVISAISTTLVEHWGTDAFETRVVFRSSLDATRTGYVRLIVGLDLTHRDDFLVFD